MTSHEYHVMSSLLGLVAKAIAAGMPVTQDVADARNKAATLLCAYEDDAASSGQPTNRGE